MRGVAAPWALLMAGLVAVAPGCSRPPQAVADPAKREDAGRAGLPKWLPPYTPAQEALLKPVGGPVQVPAARVFPDLSRFGYARARRSDVNESFKFTRLIATVLTKSPRFYAMGDAAPELANTVAQYGPPGAAEPDGWSVVTRESEDEVGEVVAAASGADARAEHDAARVKREANDIEGALGHLRSAHAKAPKVPAIALSLADALEATGDIAGATAVLRGVLAADPTYATAHAALGELLHATGDMSGARREAAEALAWHPPSRRALALADKLTSGAASARASSRPKPFAVFIDVDAMGAVHARASGSNAAHMYAGCRAVVRFEPELRELLFEQPASVPYHLSMAEEVICAEAAIGAYAFDRSKTDESVADADPALDGLAVMAEREGLSGWVMFEVLGPHRPERARAAPAEVHRAVVEYVRRHVLEASDGLPTGVYTASLGPVR